jgi:hypothetical protein
MLRCIKKSSQPKLHQYLKTVSQWLDFSYINQHNLAAHRKCLSKLVFPNWHGLFGYSNCLLGMMIGGEKSSENIV